MTDESGTYSVKKLREKSNGIWLPITLLSAIIVAAIAWGANGQRLTSLESQSIDAKAERGRMEDHFSANDQQLATLKAQFAAIQDQLKEINRKLDERERR